MLPSYATGEGIRVAFRDLEILGSVMSVRQLKVVQEASDLLDRLFDSTYSAPLAGTKAAYRACPTAMLFDLGQCAPASCLVPQSILWVGMNPLRIRAMAGEPQTRAGSNILRQRTEHSRDNAQYSMRQS
jgi:hypothetical protein